MPERKPRSDKGSYQLNARDMAVLTWVGHMYSVRLDILQSLLSREIDHEQRKIAYEYHEKRASEEGRDLERPDSQLLTVSAVYLVLRRWKKAGLVQTAQIVGQEPIYIWLTQKGIDSIGLEYRSVAPSLGLIKHFHAVNKVRLRLEELHPNALWTSERELTRRINRLNEQERRKIDHLPDGELELDDGTTLIIEVELSKKTEKRLESIQKGLKHRYLVESGEAKILYFVTDETRQAVERVAYTARGRDSKPLFETEQLETVTLKGGYS